jgi:hypothetical protein
MSTNFITVCGRLTFLAVGVLLADLPARAQIQPMVSASVDSVGSTPCAPIAPVADELKGLISPGCEVRPPTNVTPALERPLRSWSAKRYGEPRHYGPSNAKFWTMWGITGGLTAFQVQSAVHRAHEHGAQPDSGSAALYGINFGVFAAALIKQLPVKKATPEEASGWWMFPLAGDVVETGFIAYWRSH